jgi:drug/metabolite transporter (DMT)-like permease
MIHYLLLIFIQMLFGLNFLATKVILGELAPLDWAVIRFFATGIVMMSIALIMRRPFPEVSFSLLWKLALNTLLLVLLGQGVFIFGLSHTSIVNASLLTTMIPIFAFLFIGLFGMEKISRRQSAGLFLAFCGVLWLKLSSLDTQGLHGMQGDMFVLIACLGQALYLAFGKKLLKDIDIFWLTGLVFFIGAICLTPFISWPDLLKVETFSSITISWIIYSILGATLVAYLLNNWLMTKIRGSLISVFIYLQPIFAAIFSIFFYGEMLSPQILIAGIFIFFGVYFIEYKPKKSS